ncbi:MAG: thioredoxin family protein [Spirochaetes bacterium]|nr:thioredoxin family protein [Spirochaetota bacterium]
MISKFLFYTSLFFSLNSPAIAEISENIKVYPIDERLEIQAGDSALLAIKIDIPDTLYIYGNPKGPGVGRPTTIEISPPTGFTFSSPGFTTPKKYTPKGESDYVWIYEKEARVDIPFKVQKTTKPGNYYVAVSVKALLCSDKACFPQDISLNYPVRVSTGTYNAAQNKNSSGIILSQNKLSDDAFQKNRRNKTYSNELSSIKPIFITTLNVSNILQAILFGIIAGFILNFMPCVLPVISLKILDIVKYSGNNRKENIKSGLIFSLGILTTFAILAFLAAFLGYSWGTLFQNSLFLITMIVIVFILSLSMFGVFMLNTPGFAGKNLNWNSNKYAGAYTKGLLVTLLATPCSGPFLGGTLAWTATQPYFIVFTVFISIGIGMSLPYFILCVNPGLLRFIPKPGDWMTAFETAMGFLLLGTSVYLISILETMLIMPTLWFLLSTGIAFWQYGKYGSLIRPKKNRIISGTALLLIMLAGYHLSYNYFYKYEEKTEYIVFAKTDFSLSRLFENKEKGKITIVDFTADWCPNCKLVEKTSLFTREVTEAINRNNIDLLIADLTRENPEASALLTQLGSRSIPFLAVFPAGEAFFEPLCLRDIYSKKDVLNAIEMAE